MKKTIRTPGKERSFLETARFVQGIKAQLPVLTVTGAKPGPLAVIIAAQHGREINGIAAIEQVFEALNPDVMSGTVVFLPVMNPVAVRMQRQDFPTEEYRYRPLTFTQTGNMNRTWPDQERERNVYAAEVTAAVWETYGRHADVLLDLHGWSGHSLSLCWAADRDRELLRRFGFPWHLVCDDISAKNGFSENAAWAAGIPIIVAELAPQNTIHNPTVRLAVRSIGNLLKATGLLEGEPEMPLVQMEFEQRHEEIPFMADTEGLSVNDVELGDWVKKGQRVGRILSLETLETIQTFTAPIDGLVYNIGSGLGWGEDHRDSSIVFPGQTVGLLKKPDRIFRSSVGSVK